MLAAKPLLERLSFQDGSLLGGYTESINRLALAAPLCQGRVVLDAGCGTGLGAQYLLDHGAKSVLGIDYSNEAVLEARALQSSDAAEFMVGNLNDLARLTQGRGRFGAIVCLETLPHLRDPARFLAVAAQTLEADGVFLVSTPNRDAIPLDEAGRPLYRFQHVAYSVATFEELLREVFPDVALWGQWLTPPGRLRRQRAEEQFQYQCESYYQPAAKLTRGLKNMFGRKTLPPPENHVSADSYPGDFQMLPIEAGRHPWAPTSLMAICRN